MTGQGAPFPRLIVNLKTYRETLGRPAIALCRAASALEAKLDVPIAVCPQPVDLRAAARTGAHVYAQHVDHLVRPESTGWQSADALVEAGCEGVLLNHSEHRLPAGHIRSHVEAARDAGLFTVLCAGDSTEAGVLAPLEPTAIAVEPPELIGGNVSVTTADPSVVSRSVRAVRDRAPGVLVLCGAGVKTAADVARAVDLGAHGVLVASGVARAPRPAEALRRLAEGFG